MKTMRVLTLALSIAEFGACALTVAAEARYGRSLTWHFVAVSGNQFRSVGQGSGYHAPAGTPMAAVVVKNVQVELARDGRVTRITEVTVPINPVVHGWSTARGQLVITDPYM